MSEIKCKRTKNLNQEADCQSRQKTRPDYIPFIRTYFINTDNFKFKDGSIYNQSVPLLGIEPDTPACVLTEIKPRTSWFMLSHRSTPAGLTFILKSLFQRYFYSFHKSLLGFLHAKNTKHYQSRQHILRASINCCFLYVSTMCCYIPFPFYFVLACILISHLFVFLLFSSLH